MFLCACFVKQLVYCVVIVCRHLVGNADDLLLMHYKRLYIENSQISFKYSEFLLLNLAHILQSEIRRFWEICGMVQL